MNCRISTIGASKPSPPFLHLSPISSRQQTFGRTLFLHLSHRFLSYRIDQSIVGKNLRPSNLHLFHHRRFSLSNRNPPSLQQDSSNLREQLLSVTGPHSHHHIYRNSLLLINNLDLGPNSFRPLKVIPLPLLEKQAGATQAVPVPLCLRN